MFHFVDQFLWAKKNQIVHLLQFENRNGCIRETNVNPSFKMKRYARGSEFEMYIKIDIIWKSMIFDLNLGNLYNQWYEMRNFAIFYWENVSNFRIEFKKNNYICLRIFTVDKIKRISIWCWIQCKILCH